MSLSNFIFLNSICTTGWLLIQSKQDRVLTQSKKILHEHCREFDDFQKLIYSQSKLFSIRKTLTYALPSIFGFVWLTRFYSFSVSQECEYVVYSIVLNTLLIFIFVILFLIAIYGLIGKQHSSKMKKDIP